MHKELTLSHLLVYIILLSVVPYSDDTSNINESEHGGAPTPQMSLLSSWNDLSKKDKKDGHNPFELKSLKRREQSGRNTADVSPSPIKGEDVFFVNDLNCDLFAACLDLHVVNSRKLGMQGDQLLSLP